MSIESATGAQRWTGPVAVGAMAVALTDALHELAHAATAASIQAGSVASISSVGVGTTILSPVVSLAGPLCNLVLGATVLLARAPRWSGAARLALWLFGTLNLFDATAYLVYSAILGSGDWAVALGAFAPAALWRPVAGLGGAALYAGALFGTLGVLRRLVAERVVRPDEASDFCMAAYVAGGVLLTVASMLNPISAWLILTSGVATGFGAMAGLAVQSRLIDRRPGEALDPRSRTTFGAPWLFAGAVVSLSFVLVFGRGFAFGS